MEKSLLFTAVRSSPLTTDLSKVKIKDKVICHFSRSSTYKAIKRRIRLWNGVVVEDCVLSKTTMSRKRTRNEEIVEEFGKSEHKTRRGRSSKRGKQ